MRAKTSLLNEGSWMPENHKIIPASPENIARAVQVLRAGGLVGIPTETVYGLAANALDDAAVRGLFAAKDRGHNKPVIAFVADLAAAKEIASFTPLAERLAGQFWPGQLTLVLDRKPGQGLSNLMFRDETIGLRITAQPATVELLKQLSGPLAVTSANISGSKSPVSASDLEPALLGRIELALDDGPAKMGVASTVIDARGDTPIILRQGSIPPEEVS